MLLIMYPHKHIRVRVSAVESIRDLGRAGSGAVPTVSEVLLRARKGTCCTIGMMEIGTSGDAPPAPTYNVQDAVPAVGELQARTQGQSAASCGPLRASLLAVGPLVVLRTPQNGAGAEGAAGAAEMVML